MSEFGALTVAQFDALLERKQEKHKHQFLLAGIVASTIINSNPWRGKDSKAAKATDFVPDYAQSQIQNPKSQTPEQRADALTKFFGCGPGKPGKGRKFKAGRT